MRILTCFIFILAAIAAFPQSAAKTEILTEKIISNLERLEDSYIVKLNRRDYPRAKALLDNIYSLLNELSHPDIYPMEETSFFNLKESLQNESFTANRLNIITAAAERNHFTIHQLIEIVDLLAFSEERVKAVEIIYPWIIDKNNSLLIFNAMKFSGEKEEVKKIIERYK